MLLGMLTGRHDDVSVYEIGLKVRTEADGLAVARPSRFVGLLMHGLLSGCYTVTDEQLFELLAELADTEGMEVEPSAAAGLAGPAFLLASAAGKGYLQRHHLSPGQLMRYHTEHLNWLRLEETSVSSSRERAQFSLFKTYGPTMNARKLPSNCCLKWSFALAGISRVCGFADRSYSAQGSATLAVWPATLFDLNKSAGR